MTVEKYVPEMHYRFLVAWMSQRNLPIPTYESIPAEGLVACFEGVPVCMGFLRCIEGGYALLDGLVTNPEASKTTRDCLLDNLVSNIMSLAKELKFKTVIAYSDDDNTLLRSERHGFVKQRHTFIAAKIN